MKKKKPFAIYNISGHRVPVYLVPPSSKYMVDEDGDYCIGICRYDRRQIPNDNGKILIEYIKNIRIHLANNLSPKELKDTLKHELLHALNAANNCKLLHDHIVKLEQADIRFRRIL